jgi:hypothetical protein
VQCSAFQVTADVADGLVRSYCCCQINCLARAFIMCTDRTGAVTRVFMHVFAVDTLSCTAVALYLIVTVCVGDT